MFSRATNVDGVEISATSLFSNSIRRMRFPAALDGRIQSMAESVVGAMLSSRSQDRACLVSSWNDPVLAGGQTKRFTWRDIQIRPPLVENYTEHGVGSSPLITVV